MKISYIIIGAAIIGVGVCVYLRLKGKKRQNIAGMNPDEKLDKREDFMVKQGSDIPDITDAAKKTFSDIAIQHQTAAEILRDTVEEIKATNNETEQKKREIDELLNDLNK